MAIQAEQPPQDENIITALFHEWMIPNTPQGTKEAAIIGTVSSGISGLLTLFLANMDQITLQAYTFAYEHGIGPLENLVNAATSHPEVIGNTATALGIIGLGLLGLTGKRVADHFINNNTVPPGPQEQAPVE